MMSYDGVLLTYTVSHRRIPVWFYLDMSVSVAELLGGSNNMFPNTISLDLLPRREIFNIARRPLQLLYYYNI